VKVFRREAQKCRRGTARRAVSVETVQNVAQMLVELQFKSPATSDHLQGQLRSLEIARIDRPYDTYCWWYVVKTCLSCTVSAILPLSQCA